MQYQISDNYKKAKTLASIIEQSYLEPWMHQDVYIQFAGQQIKLCDYLLVSYNQIIMIDNHQTEITQLANIKETLQATQTGFIHNKTKYLQQIIKQLTAADVQFFSAHTQSTIVLPKKVGCQYVCASKFLVKKDDKLVGIKHDYRKEHYQHLLNQEHQMLPVVMSLSALKKSIQSLATVTDFIDFIHYANRCLTENDTKELNYLQSYVISANVFKRAREIDEILVTQQVKAQKTQLLAITNEKQHLSQFSAVKKSIGFWGGFIQSMLHPSRIKGQQPDPTYNRMLYAMMSESIFSRYLLMSCIHDCMNASQQRLKEGYIVHMRSFSHIDRHYVFYFYSYDANSPHHRTKASLQLQQIAQNVNQKNQNPPLSEIIVIGLEMIENGFDIDMCYMQGRKLVSESGANNQQ